MKQKIFYVILAIGFCLGAWLRLKDVTAPLADWHSFRQADTASVAREFVKHGINLLEPKYQDLSSIQSGLDNPEGYRMVEFPLVSGAVAFLYQLPLFNSLSLHVFYRLFDVTLSLISAVFLYLIVKKLQSIEVATASTLAFLLLPFNLFYSRTILPEVAVITFSLAGVYLGMRYIDKANLINFLISFLVLSVGLLIKPITGFFYLPLLGYAVHKRGISSLFNWKYIFLTLISIVPLIVWRQWITQFPSGIPDSSWLLNGNNIRFKGAFFYWLFADRIGRLMLGYWGVSLLTFGLLARKKSSVFIWWIAASLLYLIVFATGNVQHDYYQIPIIPTIAIYLGFGINYLLTTKSFSKVASFTLLAIVLCFSFSFSWYHIRAYYGINNPAIVEAGQAVDELTPSDSLIIAPYMGDTAFLYQTNRTGWPIGLNIEDKIQKGADYYVSVNFDDETNHLMTQYQALKRTDSYVILDLSRPLQLFSR